jgi:hypothetical protein
LEKTGQPGKPTVTNGLAYFASASLTKEMFYDTDIWANFIKKISSSLKLPQKATAFVPWEALNSGIM